MKSPPHGTPANRRTALASLDPDVKDAAGSQANCGKNSVFKQFHRTLFEHCTQLSVVVEILARKIFSALHRLNRQCATGTYTNAQCSEAITKAFSHFLKSFRDFYIPKLSFPIWSTLNTMLMTRDYLSGYVAPDMRSLLPDGSDSAYDSLSDIFVRGCAYPLLKNGKEARK